jgi:hypothetical protein
MLRFQLSLCNQLEHERFFFEWALLGSSGLDWWEDFTANHLKHFHPPRAKQMSTLFEKKTRALPIHNLAKSLRN